MDAQGRTYALGYSETEERRLRAQAELIEDLTEDVFRRAGLKPGMRVLDLGCGIGDVSMLAARMVGSSGAVVGIDRAGASVQKARSRVAAAGLANVRFEEAHLEKFTPGEKYDALVGRLILMYLSDAAAVLRQLRDCLRPGGVIVFQEIDMSQVSRVPSSALFESTHSVIMAAFRAVGAETDMGSKLASTFVRANLPQPTMIAATRVESGSQSPAYEYIAAVVRSLAPVIERFGIATAEQIGIETLADRLRDEAIADECVTFLPRFVGAWARMPLS
jgi:ubiquinone/menaquinone biosynthesis C-methylase UbiE